MKLRVQVTLDFSRSLECVEHRAEHAGPGAILRRVRSLLRASRCWMGFHKLIEDEERSCCWGGVDRCTHCGKEEQWSNSYR